MKLLNRTLLGFLLYSVAVLVIVTPVFYFVINHIIIHQVDETLRIHRREIQARLDKLPTEEDVRQWEDLDGEVVVEPLVGPISRDKIYTIHRRHADYRVLSAAVEIKGKMYQLEARISLVESEDLISALVLIQVLVLIILLGGMLLINWWNSKTVWRPFYNTLGQLKSFRIEKNSPVSLPPSNIAEFNDLNAAIEELTKRDQQAFVSQREFTENAAHEMQTPLAIFQSKLDILLQTKPTEAQATLLESLLDTTQRLNRLNRGLLLLSKIDNRQFPETDEIELYAATLRILGLYQKDADLRDLSFRVSGMKPVFLMNSALADMLLTNLVSNAVRYAKSGSEILIVVTEDSWSISNQGDVLSIPAERIFDRFQKGNTHKDSLGLGLAIAKKICDTNDLVISYAFLEPVHRFSLQFPQSKVSPKSHR